MPEYLNELVGIIYRGSGVKLATAERLAKKIKEAGWGKLPPIEDMTNFYRAWALSNGYVKRAEEIEDVRNPDQ